MTDLKEAPQYEGVVFPDLEKMLYDSAANRRKVYPCHTNRASAIGDPCIRSLVYSRLRWEDQELYSVESQMIFDEGNNQEPIVVRDMMKIGIDVLEQQRDFNDETTQITGHIDGVLKFPGNDYLFPAEIKSCSPHIFDSLQGFGKFDYMEAMETLGADGKPWLLKYPAQLHLYMYFKGKEWGLAIFKNKSTGQHKVFIVRLDMDLVDEIFKKAIKINEIVKKYKDQPEDKRSDDFFESIIPEKIKDRTICSKCNFKTVCLPDIDFGAPIKIEDDPLFEEKLDRYFEIEKDGKEYAKLNKVLTEQCRGRENSIVGKYHVTGKKSGNGWRKKIELIKKEVK